MEFGDFTEAIEKYEIAKKLPFTPPEAYINLGICLMELGQYEIALENLKRGRNYIAHGDSENYSQNDILKLAEKYISEVNRKLKKKIE